SPDEGCALPEQGNAAQPTNDPCKNPKKSLNGESVHERVHSRRPHAAKRQPRTACQEARAMKFNRSDQPEERRDQQPNRAADKQQQQWRAAGGIDLRDGEHAGSFHCPGLCWMLHCSRGCIHLLVLIRRRRGWWRRRRPSLVCSRDEVRSRCSRILVLLDSQLHRVLDL